MGRPPPFMENYIFFFYFFYWNPPQGSLGIIGGIYVKEIRIPLKSSLLIYPEYGPEVKKVDFQHYRNNMLCLKLFLRMPGSLQKE